MNVASRLRLAAVVSACLVATVPALAQPSTDPAAADAVFQKGREAAEKGEWAIACPKFSESQRLDPAPGTLLNLADCEEHLGQLASAYEHFKTALETMASNDDRIPFAKSRVEKLERSVPHLTLNAPSDLPADAKVMRDDVQLGSASFGLALPVNPGAHTIVISAPGHKEKRTTITLKAGEAETMTLHPGEIDTSAAVVAPVTHAGPSSSAHVSDAPTASGGATRTSGLVLGTIGIVGVGLGAVTGLMVLGKKSIINDPTHCNQDTHVCDQSGVDAASSGKTLSVVSTVAFAAGAAALVGGAVLFFVGDSETKTATIVTPVTYAGGAGLRVIQTF
jgi:hypothetical protein